MVNDASLPSSTVTALLVQAMLICGRSASSVIVTSTDEVAPGCNVGVDGSVPSEIVNVSFFSYTLSSVVFKVVFDEFIMLGRKPTPPPGE